MAREEAALSRRHAEYIASHAARDDDYLLRLKEAAERQGLPPIWIAPEQAALIQVLLRLTGARQVIEVGTLAGYAAIWMARAIPEGGRVMTIEVNPKHASFARQWTGASDVAERIEVVEGDGLEVLKGIQDEWADAIFIDADKTGYASYLEQGMRAVRPGGLMLADNALAFGQIFDEDAADPDVAAIRAFNDAVAADPRMQAVILPLGDGLWAGVKTGGRGEEDRDREHI